MMGKLGLGRSFFKIWYYICGHNLEAMIKAMKNRPESEELRKLKEERKRLLRQLEEARLNNLINQAAFVIACEKLGVEPEDIIMEAKYSESKDKKQLFDRMEESI